MDTEREGGDDLSSSIAITKEIGQDIGNNHNSTDVSFDLKLYYLKNIFRAHEH